MKQVLSFFAALIILSSCHHITGSGNIVTEKRSPGDFTGISSAQGIDVELRNGPATEVTVEADDNVIKYIETEVNDGLLKIRLQRNHSFMDAHLKVYITAPKIENLNASSGADIIAKDILTSSRKLSFHASSSGEIVADVDAPEVDSHASSGGSIKISGKTRSYSANASSGGEVKSFDLLSENTNVTASSGASARVHASVTLVANASSGADISYRGAANVKKSESSGGSVTKKD
jgi:Putative auto-transporter adhesin, head GIN domain